MALPPPLPPSLFTSLAKVTAPRRLPSWAGWRAGGVSWRQAKQRSRTASSHLADAEPTPLRLPPLRRPPPSPPGRAQAAPAAGRSRPLPRPPGWLARSLLRGSSWALGPAERAREPRRPARARDWEEGGGTITWERGVQRCGLRGAWLRAGALPGPRAPRPGRLARPRGGTRRWRPAEPSCTPSGSRKGGRAPDGRVGGWMEPSAAGRLHHVPNAFAGGSREAVD